MALWDLEMAKPKDFTVATHEQGPLRGGLDFDEMTYVI